MNLQFTCNAIGQGQVRRETLDGRDYVVVPVVAIRGDQVLNGEFVPASELRKGFGSWDGRPITLGHPSDGDANISANEPRVLESVAIGSLYRTRWEDEAIKGEAWIDFEKANGSADGIELLNRVMNGRPVEVSTGYWREQYNTPGIHRGAAYTAIARDLKPDHLAMLLNETGACSWADGCGAPRVNQKRRDNVKVNLLSEARTPSYNGTTSEEWSAPDLEDFNFGVESVEELTDAQRNQIALGSLLGDPGAETFAELSFFPVVEPGGELNEGALMAVIGGSGQQADIPEATYQSADAVARRLLEGEFDREGLMDNAETGFWRGLLNALGITRNDVMEHLAANQTEDQLEEYEEETMDMSEFVEVAGKLGVEFTADEVAGIPVGVLEKIAAVLAAPAPEPEMEAEEPATNRAATCDAMTEAVEAAGGVGAAIKLLTNAVKARSEQRAAQIEVVVANVEMTEDEAAELPDGALEKLAAKFSEQERKPDYSGRGGGEPVANTSGVHEYKRPDPFKQEEVD